MSVARRPEEHSSRQDPNLLVGEFGPVSILTFLSFSWWFLKFPISH